MSSYCAEEPSGKENRDLSLNATTDTRLLWSDLLESAKRFPNRLAIEIASHQISYQEVAQRAQSLAATIQKTVGHGSIPLTGIFAYRSETAYVGVVGALMAGHGYVPLNRTFPIDRTRLMLEKSMCRTVIVDTESEPQPEKILLGISHSLLIICPDREDVTELAKKLPKHQV